MAATPSIIKNTSGNILTGAMGAILASGETPKVYPHIIVLAMAPEMPSKGAKHHLQRVCAGRKR